MTHRPDAHLTSQSPQWLGSLFVLMHLPLQSEYPAGHLFLAKAVPIPPSARMPPKGDAMKVLIAFRREVGVALLHRARV